MTDLVVLLLVVLWVAVLAPRAVRHLKESSSTTSIEDFHQQLYLLERAGPKLFEPAYRLASGDDAMDQFADAPAGYGRRTDLVLVDTEAGRRTSTQPMARTAGRRSAGSSRRARRRRRDVLLGALGTALLTGALGAMHALHLLWVVTGVSVLAIAGYVALVAYAQMLDADRRAARAVRSGPPPVGDPIYEPLAPRSTSGAARYGSPGLKSTTPVSVRPGPHWAWEPEPAGARLPQHALGMAQSR